MSIFRKLEPELGLITATLCWGVTFPLIRIALSDMDPHDFVAIRFLIATLSLSPFVVMSTERRRAAVKGVPLAIGVGVVVYLIFLSQTIGLKTVSSPRGAFITGTNLLFVPLFSLLFKTGTPKRSDLFGICVATVGLYLLVDPGSVSGVSAGDLWILLCACLVALQIHIVQKLAQLGVDDFILAYLKIAGVAVCALLTLPFVPTRPIHWSVGGMVSLLVCALVVTTGTLWLQARYQKRTTTERAALIFSLEPVFATFFGYLILGETLSVRGFVGAALILGAVLGAELYGAHKRAQARRPTE